MARRNKVPEEEDRFNNTLGKPARGVSVKVAIGMLILLGIVCAVSVASVVSWVSGDRALHDTRESGDTGTSTCFDTATNNLEQVATDLLAYSTTAVNKLIVDFFDVSDMEMTKLIKLSTVLHSTTDQSTWDFMESITPSLWLHLDAAKHNGVYSVSFSTATKTQIVFETPTLPPGIYTIISNNGSYQPRTHSEINFFFDGTITPVGFIPPSPVALSAKNSHSWFYISNGRLPARKRLWSSIAILAGFIGYSFAHWVPNPVGPDDYIIQAVTVHLTKISTFLSSIAQKTREDTGADIKIYSCVASATMRDGWLEMGLNETLAPASDLRVLTGVSAGEYYQPQTSTSSPVEFLDINATDPVIRGVAEKLDGDYAGVMASKGKRLRINVNGTEAEYFVQVGRYTNAGGIDWWITTVIDTEYVLGATLAQQEYVRGNITEDKNRIKDRVDEDRLVMLLTVSGACVVLVAVSIWFTHLILDPFKRLEEDMQQVAEMHLENHSERPSAFMEVRRMQKSFSRMVKNLEDFKAYVPTSVLSGGESCALLTPPDGNIGIVFTDIEGSTALWDKAPAAMNSALEVHNLVMRGMIDKHRGYEVKTIGDAFMVAFEDAIDALKFCFAVQQGLLEEQWSPDLDLPPLHVTGTEGTKRLLWSGLRVRMGMHAGDVILEDNMLTGRSDYRGTTVNTAARLEGKAKAGSVCISKKMYDQISQDIPELSDPVVRPHGEHDLKGLGMQELCLMVPNKLKERLSPYMLDTPSETRSTTDKDRSSYHSESSKSAVIPLNMKKTDLSLATGQLSVAVCKLLGNDKNVLFDHCNSMVRLAVEAAVQTDGVVGHVSGMAITVVWNGSKSCKMHTTAALRFAAQLERRGVNLMKVGLGSGPMSYGNVGTMKKRFPTMFGRPLEAAEAAAEHAVNLGTFCLLADCTPGNTVSSNPAIYPFVRVADVWMDIATNTPITMLELLGQKLLNTLEDSWGTVSGSHPEIDQHNAAFAKALRGDPEGLNQMRLNLTLSTEDKPLKRMIELIECSPNVKPTHRLCVRFSSLPDGVLRNIDVVVHEKVEVIEDY